MRTTGPFITRNEAAGLTGASASSVNKAIEQKLIGTRKIRGGQMLSARDVLALAWFKLGVPLSVSQKRRIRDWVREGASDELRLADGFVVRVEGAVEDVISRTQRYIELRDRYLEINPDILGGEPVIRGSRVPIRGLARQIADGESVEVLREDYPNIPEEACEFAVQWAEMNPRRGRPARTAATAGRHQPAGRAAALRARRARADATVA